MIDMRQYFMVIRPVKKSDIADLHAIYTSENVFETMGTLPTDSVINLEKDFENKINHPVFVADIGGQVIGICGLKVRDKFRERHCGYIYLCVHADWQGNGVGRKLLTRMLEVSDKWLMLRRIELGVYANNEKAINLYKSCGFVIEGCRKYAAIYNGEYADMLIMARYASILKERR